MGYYFPFFNFNVKVNLNETAITLWLALCLFLLPDNENTFNYYRFTHMGVEA